MVQDIWDKLANWVLLSSVSAAGVFAVTVIGWQVYTWLRLGAWPELPFFELFRYFEIDLTIVYAPTDWHGIAKIAQWILGLPLSLSVPVLIVLAGGIVKGMVSGE